MAIHLLCLWSKVVSGHKVWSNTKAQLVQIVIRLTHYKYVETGISPTDFAVKKKSRNWPSKEFSGIT